MLSPARPFATAALAVRLGRSRFGTPEPQIEVRFPRSARHRQVAAALHLLAAAAELATSSDEVWCVQRERQSDTVGRVYLELADGSDDEARRGLALLETVRNQALNS
jgi:predicted phosphoribosyltransferase